MNRITITPELAARLAADRAILRREEQRFEYEDALALAVECGKAMCSRFKIDQHNEMAYTQFAKWLVGDPTMIAESPEGKTRAGVLTKGIYLQGAVGAGKSMCMDIFKIVARYLDIKIGDDQITWASPRTDQVCEYYRQQGEYMQYARMRSVCFQDLGCEQGESIYMGNRLNVMRQILEYRGDYPNSLTMITTNIPISKIGDFYGSRVQSRLIQMCNILTISGEDRRK